jgi:fatty acid-binding protein DegV
VGSAVVGASVLLAVPAHAAGDTTAACAQAVTAANKAEAAYQAALASYKQELAAGGHPGTAEQSNLESLKNAANLATSDAARICPVTPSGTVHTGAGSTSEGVNTAGLAAGVAVIAAAGATGALVISRRRAAGRS